MKGYNTTSFSKLLFHLHHLIPSNFRDTATLAEISAHLGYSSQSYFQNVFKNKMGTTPAQYRKAQEKTQ